MAIKPSCVHKASEARQRLTAELLGYGLLRLSRHFILDEYELLADIPAASALNFRSTFPFNQTKQDKAAVGANLNANTFAAFNRVYHTLESLGVVERVAGLISKVVVPPEKIEFHLRSRGALDAELFEVSVYHFFNCHGQAEWGRLAGTQAMGQRFRYIPVFKTALRMRGCSPLVATDIYGLVCL